MSMYECDDEPDVWLPAAALEFTTVAGVLVMIFGLFVLWQAFRELPI